MSISYDEFVKEPGMQIEYTQEQIKELIKCKNDFNHFSKYIKITTENGTKSFEPYDFQRDMIDIFKNNRFCCILSSRQSRKMFIISNTYKN